MTIQQERTARGIITLGSYVLLCQGRGESYWCMPGGHCEAGEHPADTLRREIWEETGREIARMLHLATLQNDFDKGGVHIQEEMWLYQATLTPIFREDPAQSTEDHLTFAWAPIVELEHWQVMPPMVIPYIQFVGGS